MPFSDEFLEKWEHIIDEVTKTEVPLECIKKVVIRFDHKRQRTVNISQLRQKGLAMDEIETVLTQTLDELGDTVCDINFIVDAAVVAEIVQPATDKTLSGL